MPTALVTDAERTSALGMIRSLDRAGWRVVAATHARRAPGASSRHTAAVIRHVDPLVDRRGAIDALRDAVRREHVDVLFPVSDHIAVPLMSAREQFEPGCRLALADADAVEVFSDKSRTVELATRLGVPVPATRVARTPEDLEAVAGQLGWPLVLKPVRSLVELPDGGAVRLSVTYATGMTEAIARLQPLAEHGPVLLQRHCRGTGVAVNVLANEGRVVAAVQQRRLHEVPLTGGPSSLRETEPLDDDLLRYARVLIEATRWSGLAMVELKVGPGGPVLMEVNGRVWGSLALAIRAGMDFPALWGAMLLGQSVTPTCAYVAGVRTASLSLEARWILHVLRGQRDGADRRVPRREAAAALGNLARGRHPQDAFALRDPKPGFVELLQLLASASRIIRR